MIFNDIQRLPRSSATSALTLSRKIFRVHRATGDLDVHLHDIGDFLHFRQSAEPRQEVVDAGLLLFREGIALTSRQTTTAQAPTATSFLERLRISLSFSICSARPSHPR